MAPAPKRFITMDGVRGVAALCVFVMHLSGCLGQMRLSGAGASVDIFFGLSGFVVAGAYERQLEAGSGARAYLVTRFARLYPLYAIGLIAGFGLQTVVLAHGDTVTGWRLSSIALMQGALMLPILVSMTTGTHDAASINTAFPFNMPSWSLFFECASNLAFAWFRPRGRGLAAFLALTLALFAGSALLLGRMPGLGIHTLWGGWPRALFGFYAGVGMRRLWDNGARGGGRLGGWAPLLVIGLAMQPFGRSATGDLVVAAACAPAVVWLSTHDPRSAALARLYGWLGRMSYPLYALHWPAIGLFAFVYRRVSGAGESAPLPMPLVFAFAILLVFACGATADHVEPRLRRGLLSLLNVGRTPQHDSPGLAADRA